MLFFSLVTLLVFFFFKQKTAYEIRPRDWSSDVCSSDPAMAALSASAIQFDGFLTTGASWHDDKNKNRYIGRSEERRVGKECRSRGAPDH